MFLLLFISFKIFCFGGEAFFIGFGLEGETFFNVFDFGGGEAFFYVFNLEGGEAFFIEFDFGVFFNIFKRS